MSTVLNSQIQSVAGWANYPKINANVFSPTDRVGVREVVIDNERLIARGNGKSYGDASLGPIMLSTLSLNKILSFDAERGIVSCESGVLLSELLQQIIPAGWFFQVTPGIKEITVGGAIASDVHGKNHPSAGCFSNYLISFELMLGDGEIRNCSREENASLFWQTCGGMGWSGIILSAKFSLMKISTTNMRQKTVRPQNLEAIFQAFQTHQQFPYAAGWVDCTDANWRGAVFFAEHVTTDQDSSDALVFEEAPKKNVSFYAPSWFLNPWSIKAHNFFYHRKNADNERVVTLDKYFYPLDAMKNWNRFYGRRGFVQYQFCLPDKFAYEGMRKVLETTRLYKEIPFLTVLKRHGQRPASAINSFPIEGYSLALDFPRTSGIFKLVKKLDELVWSMDGKIYLTKDACSDPKMGRVNPASFGEEKFCSLLKERIGR